jgi:diadenosine tetraphosphatase ApaH/serine/threonine PP2A family protein phosphatase
MLSEASLRWAASLPDHLVRHEARFVHGCPPRAVNLYLFQVPDHALPTVFSRYPEQVCFVGHTHELELVSLARNTARRLRLEEGTTALDPRARHIVNAGSVGQPRDGDSHAKYLIWDTRAMEIEVRFVEYDVASTVTSIRNKGLPERDAARLAALDRRRRGGDG